MVIFILKLILFLLVAIGLMFLLGIIFLSTCRHNITLNIPRSNKLDKELKKLEKEIDKLLGE